MDWQTFQASGAPNPVTTGRKAYVYRYDELSRLTLGGYHENNSGSWEQTNRFNEWISGYDLNGNIKGLKRTGSLSNWSTATIDQLTYHYQGNQLIAVDDRVGSDNGYDFFDNGHFFYNSGIHEYEYDANGNIKKDANKGIINIAYNYNNLPVEIDLLRDNKLVYLYGKENCAISN